MKKKLTKTFVILLTCVSVLLSLNVGVSADCYDEMTDGELDTIDYMMLRRTVLGTYNLDELKSLAADIDDDGVIGILDYMMLKRYVLRTFYFSP